MSDYIRKQAYKTALDLAETEMVEEIITLTTDRDLWNMNKSWVRTLALALAFKRQAVMHVNGLKERS